MNKSKCILWTGTKQSRGYGWTQIDGIKMLAHRAAFMQANPGISIRGLQVCHRCDVRLCINPKHLFVGTNDDNMRDMIAKGRARHPAGENHSNAKLTLNEVVELRATFKRQTAAIPLLLARKYGVTQQCVMDIVRGKYWKEGRELEWKKKVS